MSVGVVKIGDLELGFPLTLDCEGVGDHAWDRASGFNRLRWCAEADWRKVLLQCKHGPLGLDASKNSEFRVEHVNLLS